MPDLYLVVVPGPPVTIKGFAQTWIQANSAVAAGDAILRIAVPSSPFDGILTESLDVTAGEPSTPAVLEEPEVALDRARAEAAAKAAPAAPKGKAEDEDDEESVSRGELARRRAKH